MATSVDQSSQNYLLMLASLLIFMSTITQAQKIPPIVDGLAFNFYNSSCPETQIRQRLLEAFKNDMGLAAGLLRLHFHDCFVQGCDGSILLDGSEQREPPNLSLRRGAIQLIDQLRALVLTNCNINVSCSDSLTIAARDAVFLSGGPDYAIPLGRLDGTTLATEAAALQNLPPPNATVNEFNVTFTNKTFDVNDLVALSGRHSIGITNCTAFAARLYPTTDPTMNRTFVDYLETVCPENSTNTTVIDLRSPFAFDNRYYVNLVNRQGLFTSDQDLFVNETTTGIVVDFANNQSLFFERFVFAMIKMGQLDVLTGNDTRGELRRNCSRRNSDDNSPAPVLLRSISKSGVVRYSAAFGFILLSVFAIFFSNNASDKKGEKGEKELRDGKGIKV